MSNVILGALIAVPIAALLAACVVLYLRATNGGDDDSLFAGAGLANLDAGGLLPPLLPFPPDGPWWAEDADRIDYETHPPLAWLLSAETLARGMAAIKAGAS